MPCAPLFPGACCAVALFLITVSRNSSCPLSSIGPHMRGSAGQFPAVHATHKVLNQQRPKRVCHCEERSDEAISCFKQSYGPFQSRDSFLRKNALPAMADKNDIHPSNISMCMFRLLSPIVLGSAPDSAVPAPGSTLPPAKEEGQEISPAFPLLSDLLLFAAYGCWKTSLRPPIYVCPSLAGQDGAVSPDTGVPERSTRTA